MITAAIAAPIAYASKRLALIDRQVRVTSGLVSLGFGFLVIKSVS
jgi:hypothetical protein